jgi:hypothetical protein
LFSQPSSFPTTSNSSKHRRDRLSVYRPAYGDPIALKVIEKNIVDNADRNSSVVKNTVALESRT